MFCIYPADGAIHVPIWVLVVLEYPSISEGSPYGITRWHRLFLEHSRYVLYMKT